MSPTAADKTRSSRALRAGLAFALLIGGAIAAAAQDKEPPKEPPNEPQGVLSGPVEGMGE